MDPTSITAAVWQSIEPLVAKLLDDRLAAAAPANDNADEWLTPKQVAALTGYTRRYVVELSRRGGLPRHGTARKPMYRRSEVESWIEKRGK